MSQTILFVCATGIATSTAVTEKVMEYCKEHGLNVNYSQTNVASLPGNTDGVALVVSTTKVPYELDVPVVNGRLTHYYRYWRRESTGANCFDP